MTHLPMSPTPHGEGECTFDPNKQICTICGKGKFPLTFTPGPWRAGKLYSSVVSDTDPGVGLSGYNDTAAYGGFLIAESIADQHVGLIAAAPELLTALVRIRGIALTWGPPTRYWDAFETAAFAATQDAIAKATGGAQ